MKLTKLFLFPFILFIGLHVQAQDQEELKKYIEEARKAFNIPGMSVGIVKDGEIVMLEGFGVTSVETGQKVDANSVFAIASISKAFTVTALAMLEEDGKLSWEDPVQKHLSYFRLHDPYVSSLINIEDLTCHRSGLATFDGDLLWYGTNYSRREIVERISKLPLKKTFRTDFGYQNIMYITSGEVIKRVSGVSWDQFIFDNILKPLKMENTISGFSTLKKSTNLAKPHVNGELISMLSYDNSGATASLNSNITDMTKWISMWLNNGVYEGDTLLSKSSIRKIWEPHTILSTGSFDARNGTHFKAYGMAWFLMDYNGYKVIHHGGGLPGYISKIALVPEMNMGMIILTNDMTSLPTALMYKIIDFYSNKGDRDWAAEFLEYKKGGEAREIKEKEKVDATRIKDTKFSHQLKEYTGTYEDVMYGKATIEFKNDELVLTMVPTKELFTSTLSHWHYDTFEIKFNDPFLPRGFVTFEVDDEGKISGFKINLPNPDFHFSNLHFEREKVK